MMLKHDLILVGVGRVVVALLGLVSIHVVTKSLSLEQYGELTLLMTSLTFCGLFLINPIAQHISLHTHAWWDDRTLVSRLRSYRIYIAIVAAIGFISVLLLNKQDGFLSLLSTASVMLVMVMAYTWNSTLIPMLNQLGFRLASTTWGVITAAIALITSLALTHWMPSALMWFTGQCIGMTAGALGAKIVFHRNATKEDVCGDKLPLMNRSTFYSYCLPLSIATGLMWLQLSGYRLLVDNYWGLRQLGFLAIGIQLSGQILSVAEALAMQFLYPYFFRRVSDFENKTEVEFAYSDLLNTVIPVYMVLAGLVVLSAPFLLKVLVGEQYQQASRMVMLGAAIDLCRMMGNVLSNAAHVARETKFLSVPYAIGATASFGSVWLAGELHVDISWAAYGLLAGGIAMLVAMALSMYQRVNFKLDTRRNGAALVMMVLLLSLSQMTPSMPSLGLSLGMLLLIGASGGVIILFLLRKNPATLRMLDVQLRK